MAKYSVVIAVYNKEKYIQKTLQSVLDQTYSDFEVIIVNDGSTDNSEAVIKSFNDPRISYYSQKNKGAGAARNAAIKRASSPWVALLDADDIWLPYYLEEQYKLLVKYPEQMVFATNSSVLKNNRKRKRTYSFDCGIENDCVVNYFEASYLDSVLHSSTTIIHRNIFNKVGFYNPDIKSGQDTDLYVRVGLEYDIVFTKKICAYYNINESSLFESARKISEKANFIAYEKYENDNPKLKKFLDLNRYSLCIIAKLEGNKIGFKDNFGKIDLKNISRRQRLLLKQNKTTLKLLLWIKGKLGNSGIYLTSFK